MSFIEKKPEEMLPLNPIVFNILSVLGTKTLHGYEIKKQVEADMQNTVPTATLYRHLRAMRDDRLIEEVAPPIQDDDPRRQYFKMTAYGQTVYGAEYNRLSNLLRKPQWAFSVGKAILSGGC